MKIFRDKIRTGIVDKINDNYVLLVKDLFKKETDISIFVNKTVVLQLTNNEGKILSAFGKSGKIKA